MGCTFLFRGLCILDKISPYIHSLLAQRGIIVIENVNHNHASSRHRLLRLRGGRH